MKSRPKNSGLSGRVLAVLGSVLAAGAIAPQLQQVQLRGPSAAADRNAPTTITRQTPGTNRAERPAPAPSGQQVGQALADLMGSGGATFRDPGCPPHIWGQSAACKKMRLKNVRLGNQPHYKPRARA